MTAKRLLSYIVPLCIVVAAGTLAVAKDPPKKVTLDKCKKKKSAVEFDHEMHVKKNKIACKKCHHTGKNVACSTAKCHAGKADGKKPGCAEMSLKKNPYHIRCVGCHKKGLNGKKGPRKCKDCHK